MKDLLLVKKLEGEHSPTKSDVDDIQKFPGNLLTLTLLYLWIAVIYIHIFFFHVLFHNIHFAT